MKRSPKGPWIATALAVGLCAPIWADSFCREATYCPPPADGLCSGRDSCNQNWQQFVAPASHAQAPDSGGTTYFDGFSWDGPNANIAYFVEGQGLWVNDPSSPQQQLPFWGQSDGAAVPSFYFQRTSTSMVADLVSASGQWAPYNSLGWYDPFSNAWGWIFEADGTAPVPHAVDFTPTAHFGLFFVPDSLTFDPTEAYYTDSTRNGIAAADQLYAAQNGITLGPETSQHFAVFDLLSGGYLIGINDRSSQISDLDYNDMILTLLDAPEPGMAIPLGMLLAILLTFRRPLCKPNCNH